MTRLPLIDANSSNPLEASIARLRNSAADKPCAHHPTRIHSWFAFDNTLCVCCNDCGKVLSGGC